MNDNIDAAYAKYGNMYSSYPQQYDHNLNVNEAGLGTLFQLPASADFDIMVQIYV
jgi:hypothetical protein